MADATAALSAFPDEDEGQSDLPLILGRNLRRLRTRQGHSLERLAKLSGVSRAMLSQIETGKSAPTINLLWKISTALGIPFATLLDTQKIQGTVVLRRIACLPISVEVQDFCSLCRHGMTIRQMKYSVIVAGALEQDSELLPFWALLEETFRSNSPTDEHYVCGGSDKQLFEQPWILQVRQGLPAASWYDDGNRCNISGDCCEIVDAGSGREASMSDANDMFTLLRQCADVDAVNAMEQAVAEAPDHRLCRINPIAFADRAHLDEEAVIAAFLHGARIGLFEMSWNVLCPGCGGVLDTNASLKTIQKDEYVCALCAEGYAPTLDEMVEVTFTISPRVRRIAAHSPNELPLPEYYRQMYWGSAIDIPEEGYEELIDDFVIDHVEVPPGEKAVLSVQLPPEFIIVFEPVTHAAQFIDVKGEATRERQTLALSYDRDHTHNKTLEMRPGPLRLSVENRTDTRVLPSICIAGDTLHNMLGKRRDFLTAKRLLSNQTFRDLYHTDTLEVDQRLKITSLTFLFTDLRGSTELYERVGDLTAFDLVRAHFQVLQEIVASEAGAVVKTIGDAVMATFPTPDRAVTAAIRMREAMMTLNAKNKSEDLLLKIGVHEGPCIAVNMNERQDYFGQTVNIASRVQGLANTQSIFVTSQIIVDAKTASMLKGRSLMPAAHDVMLRGIERQVQVYEIP